MFTPYDFASLWTCARREVLDGMDDLVRRGDEMAKPERGENYYQTARDWELDTLSYARIENRFFIHRCVESYNIMRSYL